MYPGALLDYLLRHRMQHLILHVTSRCNLRCAHCFVDFDQQTDLPLERYKQLAEEVGRFFWLDVAGGEPFLRPDLAEIVSSFRCRVIQIPTNGWLADAAVEQVQAIRRATKADVVISISIDGLEATHDRIRGKQGSWRHAWDTFDRLRQIGVPVKINTVLVKQNAGEILELMREVRRRGPDFHSVILHRGEAHDPLFSLPPLDEVHRLGRDIFDVLRTYDYGKGFLQAHILRNYHRYLWNLSLATLRRRRQVIPCLAGKAHMVVWGNGGVSSCEMLPVVGSIASQSWKDILSSEAFIQQKQTIRRKGCFCTHNCAMLDSILMRLRSFWPLMYQKLD